jgi:hypothetical protein
MKRTILVGLLLYPSVSLLAAPGIETTFLPVAVSGQSAPGFTNALVKFEDIRDFSLADNGDIAFTGDVTGPGVTGTNGMALWAGTPYSLAILARTGTPEPDGTNVAWFSWLGSPNVDNVEGVGFLALREIATNQDLSAKDASPANEANYSRLKREQAQYDIDGPNKLDLQHGDVIEIIVTSPVGSLKGFVVNQVAMSSELAGTKIGTTNNWAIVGGPPTTS